jgi:hypothetical protein
MKIYQVILAPIRPLTGEDQDEEAGVAAAKLLADERGKTFGRVADVDDDLRFRAQAGKKPFRPATASSSAAKSCSAEMTCVR